MIPFTIREDEGAAALPSLEAGQAGETFRQWSLAVLGVLCPAASSASAGVALDVRHALERFLIARFEQNLQEATAQLRQEIPAWQETARHLASLTDCRVLPLFDAARLLREQLRVGTTQAAALLAALESLQSRREVPAVGNVRVATARTEGTVPPPPEFSLARWRARREDSPKEQNLAPKREDTAPRESKAPAEPHQAPSREDAVPPWPTGDSGVPPASVNSPPPSGSPRAATHCRRGDAYRQKGENERALQEYTAAIGCAPVDKEAYLRRGRLYRLLGDPGRAIEDFAAAALIAPNEPEVFRLRAQARLACGQVDQAVEDFDRALRLQPGCPTTRVRRAAALRLQGKAEQAVAEFTELIHERPDQPILYFQRGLAHLDDGDRERAILDFTKATQLNPHFKEAHEKCQEARAGRTPPPVPVSSPAKPADTVPGTSAAQETQPENSVRVMCPQCGAEGNVRWDRLSRILTCRGCSKHYRVDTQGRLTEVIRTPDGRWVVRGSRQAPPEHAGRGWMVLTLVPVAVLLLVMVGLWGWRQRHSVPVEPDLPKGLSERAELLAKAWLKKDVPLMRRLTVATHDRILYSWFVRHQPPVKVEGESEEDAPVVKVLERKERTARILMQAPARGARPAELRLFWEYRGDTWFFVPPAR